MTELLCLSPVCRPPGRHGTDCKGEPDKPCRGCLPALAADGLRLCWHDTERIGKDAVEAADLWAELALMLVGASQAGDGIRQKHPGQGLNLRPAVAEHRATIRHTLVSWTLLISEERGIGLPWRWELVHLPDGVEGPLNRIRVTDETTHALGKFISTHHQWLAAQPFAGEVAGELHDLVTLGRSLRQPSDTRIVQIGPCPRTVEEDDVSRPCGGMLRALLRTEASLLPSAVQCDLDPAHTWDSTQWSKLGRNVPKKETMAILRRPPKTLQERIEQTRAEYAEAGVRDRFPVAVSINGGKLVYGEFSQMADEDDRMTRFGSDHREWVVGFSWQIEVEQRMDWSPNPIAVRFGDEQWQPYEGKIRVDAVSHDEMVWTTRLVGVGELVRHG